MPATGEDWEFWRKVEDVCNLLRHWQQGQQGKDIPYYLPGRGKPFMARLLNFEPMPKESTITYGDWFIEQYKKGNYRFIEEVSGPHGWAVLKTYIVRYEQRLKRLDKAAKRNKKRREFREAQREEALYARLQDE